MNAAVKARLASAEIDGIVPITIRINFICRTERILTQMPSIIKSISLAVAVGGLSVTFGSVAIAQAQTNKASSSVKGYQPSSGASGKTAQRGTAEKTPPRGTNTAPRIATAPAPGRTQLNDPRQEAPKGKPMFIPKLSPEMEAILAEWEQKSARINRLEGTFTRITYDAVFETESHSEGKYCFEHPDKGSFETTGIPPKKGQKSTRGYTIKIGKDERWVCDGSQILRIDDQTKQYEKVPIREEDRGLNIRNSPLPFVFGLKAVEAKQRYRFELNREKTTDKQIILRVYPLTSQDLANYKKADVQLDRATCVPMAVKLYDTNDTKESLFLFSQKTMSINKQNWNQWLSGDPLKPKLGGYKLLIEPEGAASEAGGTQLAPRPVDRRSTQLPGAAGKTLGPATLPQRTAQRLEDDEPPARASTKGKARP